MAFVVLKKKSRLPIIFLKRNWESLATLLCETYNRSTIKTSQNILINILCQKKTKKKQQSIKVREK